MSRRQLILGHAAELEEYPSSAEGAHLHQVVLRRMVVDLIRPLDRRHSVVVQLIEASQIEPYPVRLYRIGRIVFSKDKLCDGP